MKNLVIFALAIVVLAGCRQKEMVSQTITAEEIIQRVDMEAYLAREIGITGFNGDVFCAYDVLSTKQDNHLTIIYLWVLCEEYYQEQQGLEKGSGISLPVAVFIQNEDNHFSIVKHKCPKDGISYGQDIRDIFPKRIWPKIIPNNINEINDYNRRAKRLEDVLMNKAKEHFNRPNPNVLNTNRNIGQ